MKSLKLIILFALIFIEIDGYAHHSAARFNRNANVEIEGTIVRYEWSNPHVYLWIEEKTANGDTVTWEIEGLSPAVLKRLGWSRDEVEVGDHVKVKGNPGRDPEKKIALMGSLERAGDSLLSMADLVASITNDDAPLKTQATNLNGIWVTLLNMQAMRLFSDKSTMNLTQKGLDAIRSYDERVDNPAINCIPDTAPQIMLLPDIKSIDLRDDIVSIKGEHEAFERIIYMNTTSHDNAEMSVQGHSIGYWEGDVLVVDTTHFLPHRTGIANVIGVPSGAEKHLVEKFMLNEDGLHLTYSFVLEDPEYLAAPIKGEVQWRFRPDLNYDTLPCDLDNAQRYTK